MAITKKAFGQINGQDITRYTLTNNKGFQVSCLDYGCIITEILAPDRDGLLENVVLGFDTLEEYGSNTHYFGAIVGRFAGRIQKGAFTIEGTDYQLAQNSNGQHLHGGPGGFHAAVWKTKMIETENESIVELTHFSPDGEEGFPGNLTMTVRYIVKNDENQLTISYFANSDKTTLLNVTNHSYFNLSGDLKRTIVEHQLTIPSGHYAELNSDMLPTGKLVPVEEDPLFDFRKGRTIREGTDSQHPQIELVGGGYDHPFLLDKEAKPVIELKDEESGRGLQVETTEPAVVLYTANHIGGSYSFKGVAAQNQLGLCLETQGMPDSIHHPHFPSAILKAEEAFESRTVYRFV
ncbi:galactose mutarotase [Planococcus sp. 11815]|uniref:aldose epimerase family protein n=1 Tax=Planococcus sp. 11815 TaxID=2939413 RepID=UPI003DA6C3BD